ncbi:sigma-70 family RNA polymerase sigma factor [Streptomyces harbinensis]
MNLTLEQLRHAKNKDMAAISAVIRETDSLISKRARRYATAHGRTDMHLAEDLEQTGRIAVWQCLESFEGDEPAQFVAYLDRALSRAMTDARREATRPGVSPYIAKAFEDALRIAGGDPYRAEVVAVSPVMGKDKMTEETARAARLSWLGLDFLDRPAGDGESDSTRTLRDVLADEIGIPGDLIDGRDLDTHRRTVIREQVHRTLGILGERQRHALKAAYGISPVPLYRESADDEELANDMGVTRVQVQNYRTKGKRRFAELYTAGARAW